MYATGRWKSTLEDFLAQVSGPGPFAGPSAEQEADTSSDEDLIHAFQSLGLPASATLEQVKTAYRELAREFHPDVVQGKGLNPEFLRFAELRFKEIKAAYDLLCETFGRGSTG